MKVDEISLWEAFLGVAKFGNFSRAAQRLRVGLPQLSKRVGKLEQSLGVKLFQRSTRRVSLTDEGKALLPKIESLLEDYSSLERQFESHQRVAGTIRLSCVPFVAYRFLPKLLVGFAKEFPEIKFEVEVSESAVNLIEGNFDMALRIHHRPEDSDLIYKKLVSNDMVLCASPVYLKAHKASLEKPEDLKNHSLLALSVHRKCEFRQQKYKMGDFYSARKIESENGAFLREVALKGGGVLLRSIWDIRDDLEGGRLVPVLKKYPLANFGHIYAVLPSRRFLAIRVRSFVDRLALETAQW